MEILDLLGNKNRLEILKQLSKEPRYVTELSEILNVGRKAIIDHLRLLKEYGLIKDFKKHGKRKYYKISENFVLKLILTENNSIIYHEDLNINKEDKKEVTRQFKDLKNLQEKIRDSSSLRERLTLLREVETELRRIQNAERYLGKKLDILIEKSLKEINEKTDNPLERKILHNIIRNGQISPEELSKRLKINRSKIFDIIKDLRKKELI